MSQSETYADAPQEIRDAVERLIRDYGSDPALLAGAIVSATSSVIAAAKKEEREACAEAVRTTPMRFAGQTETIIRARLSDAIRKRGEA